MKNHHKREDNPLGAIRYSDRERTTRWTRDAKPAWMSKKEYAKVPQFIEIRLSDIVVDQLGSRCQGYTVATTMLDKDAYPGAWLGSIYHAALAVMSKIT